MSKYSNFLMTVSNAWLTPLLLLVNVWVFAFMNDVVALAEGDNNVSSVSGAVNRTYSEGFPAPSNSNEFGLEHLKHLLFDDGVLFTLFSAMALLVALLGAAIIIGKRK